MRSMIAVLFCCVVLAACSNSTNTANTPQNTATPMATVKTAVRKTPEPVTADADSVYTELSEKACKEVKPEPDSGALYEADCPGKGGYKVIFSASDHSQVLSLIDQKGKETIFPFRDVLITAADFVLGDKVEWRMNGKGSDAKPTAIIVRLTKFPDPENLNKTESFLAVIKLAGDT
ncbi:MAG TPA: hypothetical protein VHQ01_04005, partial [Pyrinomonadaceae bacterium]|nr:hypothetical protein [Pyrinomonadaceae bacterium]